MSFEVVRSHYVRVEAPALPGPQACMEQDDSPPVHDAGRGTAVPAVAAQGSRASASPERAPPPHGPQAPEPQDLRAPDHCVRMAESGVAAVNALLDAMQEEATAVVRAGTPSRPPQLAGTCTS